MVGRKFVRTEFQVEGHGSTGGNSRQGRLWHWQVASHSVLRAQLSAGARLPCVRVTCHCGKSPWQVIPPIVTPNLALLNQAHWRVAHASQHLLVRDLRDRTATRRHSPHTYSVHLSTGKPRRSDCSRTGNLCQSEKRSSSKAAGKVRNQTKLPFVRNNWSR